MSILNLDRKPYQNNFHMLTSIFSMLFLKTLYLIKNTIFYWQYSRKMVDHMWSILNEGYPGVKNLFLLPWFMTTDAKKIIFSSGEK